MFSERITRIKESPTLAVAARARALAAQGVAVINFGPGEPDFDTPEHVKTACVEALKKGATKYGATAGLLELRRAFCAKLERENHVQFSPDEVMVTCGAKGAIVAALQVLIGPGDEAIIPAPYWASYADEVRLCDGAPVIIPTAEAAGFKLTPPVLGQAITRKTKLLILNSPCNPTGTVYSGAELNALAQVCTKHGIWVLVDEIYEQLTYPPAQFVSFAEAAPEHRERTILVNGPSKAYAMTGWRIGLAVAPKECIARMTCWQGQVVTHPTIFAQWGAVAAYEGAQACVAAMRAEFQKRRDYIHRHLTQLPGITCVCPEGAFYAFPNIQVYVGRRWKGKPLADASAVADYLLDQAHIAVVPGEAFGTPGHLRFSYALGMEAIQEGMRRCADALKNLA